MPSESASQKLRERRRLEREAPAVRPDTRTRILIATERLLRDASLHELGVVQIMDAAEVSRGTLYSYFSSKYEIASALLSVTMEEMYAVLAPVIAEVEGLPTADQLRSVLVDSIGLWQQHRTILRATHESWPTVPELREQWLAAVATFTDALAGELDRERAAGLVSAGLDYRQRVASVLWATEHLLYVAGSGIGPDIAGEETLVDTLIDLWAGVLYPGMPEMRMRGAEDV